MNMDSLRRIIREHPIWSALIAIVGSLILEMFIGGFTNIFTTSFLPELDYTSNLLQIIKKAIYIIAVYLIVGRIYSRQILGIRMNGLAKGLLWGIIGFTFSLLLRHLLGATSWLGFSMPSVTLSANILLPVLLLVCLAFSEELIYRGGVVNMLIQGMGYSRRGVYRALLISGLLFALVHLFGRIHLSELTFQQLVLDVSFQLIDKVSIGVFLGAIYLRSNNLFAVGLLHGLYNVYLVLPTIILNADSSFISAMSAMSEVKSIPDYSDLPVIILSVVPLLFGLFLARKITPIEQENT